MFKHIINLQCFFHATSLAILKKLFFDWTGMIVFTLIIICVHSPITYAHEIAPKDGVYWAVGYGLPVRHEIPTYGHIGAAFSLSDDISLGIKISIPELFNKEIGITVESRFDSILVGTFYQLSTGGGIKMSAPFSFSPLRLVPYLAVENRLFLTEWLDVMINGSVNFDFRDSTGIDVYTNMFVGMFFPRFDNMLFGLLINRVGQYSSDSRNELGRLSAIIGFNHEFS